MRRAITRTACATVAVGAFFALVGCERQPPAPGAAANAAPAWREVRDDELTPAQKANRDAAMSAVADLQQTLLTHVAESMKANGPPGTITVCKDLAPQLAADVGAEHGMRIGRTSHRLRNPDNLGPAWMQPIVSVQRDQVVTLAGPGDAVRMAIPIHVASPCLACHGPIDMFAPGVASTLAEQYPRDTATGFAEGDLRGWFWVEPVETP